MSPRPDATAIRKPQIIEAAIAVVRNAGFANARMDDIAGEAGVSKGLLYRYFKSKDDLILAILTEMLDREVRDIRALLEVDEPVPQRLLKLNQLAVADIHRFLEVLPITYEFYARAARQAAVGGALQQSYAEMRSILTTLIEQGVARGELRIDEPGDAATTLLAIYEGLMVLYALDPDTVHWDRQTESAVRLVLQGMQA